MADNMLVRQNDLSYYSDKVKKYVDTKVYAVAGGAEILRFRGTCGDINYLTKETEYEQDFKVGDIYLVESKTISTVGGDYNNVDGDASYNASNQYVEYICTEKKSTIREVTNKDGTKTNKTYYYYKWERIGPIGIDASTYVTYQNFNQLLTGESYYNSKYNENTGKYEEQVNLRTLSNNDLQTFLQNINYNTSSSLGSYNQSIASINNEYNKDKSYSLLQYIQDLHIKSINESSKMISTLIDLINNILIKFTNMNDHPLSIDVLSNGDFDAPYNSQWLNDFNTKFSTNLKDLMPNIYNNGTNTYGTQLSPSNINIYSNELLPSIITSIDTIVGRIDEILTTLAGKNNRYYYNGRYYRNLVIESDFNDYRTNGNNDKGLLGQIADMIDTINNTINNNNSIPTNEIDAMFTTDSNGNTMNLY